MSHYALSIGIVGLPNVGKSTLFKILTRQEVHIANYPFATIDPNVGIVAVPDERLKKLTELSKSAKTIPAVVEFYDIAGLVKGAHEGEGLGNQFLSHIRETEAIVIVLRVFKNPEIIHVEASVDPLRDMEIINSELAFKDLETLEKVVSRLEGESMTGNKKSIGDLKILKQVQKNLEENKLAFAFKDHELVRGLQLLTAKPQIYLLNGSEKDIPSGLLEKINNFGAEYIIADLGSGEMIPQLIQKAYGILGLISFLTTGPDETRAWTIKKGAKAPEAAGVIHTDFEKKFIRAEIVSYDKLVEAGGWNQAKQKGWMRLEGKDYVVQDGDVMVIRHG